MNVSLTPELEHLVSQQIASGFYNSATEVVQAALRLLQEQDDEQRHRLEALRAEIGKGLEDIAQGRVRDGQEAMAELKAKYAQPKMS